MYSLPVWRPDVWYSVVNRAVSPPKAGSNDLFFASLAPGGTGCSLTRGHITAVSASNALGFFLFHVFPLCVSDKESFRWVYGPS